jgi:hypothetical protein
MVLRLPAFLLLLFVCASALPQTSEQPNSSLPKSFHDGPLNITYFYPDRFVPDAHLPAPASGKPQCAHSTLFANAVTPVDTSSFVLSTIDNTCPSVLAGAASDLGSFVHEQILRQLKQYGEPTVTQEATHYTIDNHPAAIVLASVPMPPLPDNHLPRTTYAAKVCMLGNVPAKARKRGEKTDPPRHVLCFDYTTLHADLINLLFGFSMQFDNDSPLPLVPGNVIR